MDLAGQVESLLEYGDLGHFDRQAVRPQRRHRFDRQVLEPDGIAPVQPPGGPPQQGEHADGPLQRRRQGNGGEAPVAGFDPGRLVRAQLFFGEILDRDDLVVLERPA